LRMFRLATRAKTRTSFVRALVKALQDHGLRVWFDGWTVPFKRGESRH